MVTKLLDRKERLADLRARQAILDEGTAQIKEGKWLQDTVVDRADLIGVARK